MITVLIRSISSTLQFFSCFIFCPALECNTQTAHEFICHIRCDECHTTGVWFVGCIFLVRILHVASERLAAARTEQNKKDPSSKIVWNVRMPIAGTNSIMCIPLFRSATGLNIISSIMSRLCNTNWTIRTLNSFHPSLFHISMTPVVLLAHNQLRRRIFFFHNFFLSHRAHFSGNFQINMQTNKMKKKSHFQVK